MPAKTRRQEQSTPAKTPTPTVTPTVAPVDQAHARDTLDQCTVDEETSWLDAVQSGPTPAVAPPAAPTPAAPPAEPAEPDPAAQAAADQQVAKSIFSELDDSMGVGILNLADPSSAQQLLAGRTPSEMRAIRDYYQSQTGRTLESDVAGQFGGVAQNEMMGNVLSGMSLRDQVDHYDTSGSMENLLQTATPEQLAELSSDPAVLDTLRDKMDSEAFMKARSRLFPDQRMSAVLERITDTNGVFNDNEGGAMSAFQTLSITERKEFLANHRGALHFLNPAEMTRFEQMAVSESEALRVRMIQATLGAGTDNDSVDAIAGDAGRLMAEQQRLETSLQDNTLPDGERAALQRQLAEMGDVRDLLTPKRNDDGSLVTGSFMQRLDGDIGEGRLHALMGQMGLPANEVAKQQILDAVGFNDDERGIQEAFADVPVAQRAALWDDPHVRAAMTGNLNPEELALVESFRDNDVRAMSEERIRDGDGFFGDNERQILGAVMDMNETDRDAFLQSDLFIDTYVTLNPTERTALMEAIDKGSISVETGMAAAATGAGTNEELMGLISERTTAEDTLALRRGYVLAQGDQEAQTPEDVAALALYRQTAATMSGEMDGDEYQAEMDSLLAHNDAATSLYTGTAVDGPTSAQIERATADGRMTASLLMDARADEKMGPDGEGGGGLSSLFSDTDETAQQAHQSQKGAHYEALFDGEITEGELAGHEALSEVFADDYTAMIDAQNAITDAVATGTSIVAAIALTLATSGAAGPVVAAFMAQYGAVTTGVVMAATRIGTQEAMGGARYDSLGEAGATDAGMAVVDAATAHLGGKAGELAQGQLASRFPSVFSVADDLTGAAARQGAAGVVRRQLPSLLANNVADAASSGVINSVVGNVTDDQFWHQSLDDMALDLGGDALQSLPASLRDGLIQTGVKGGMLHLDAGRTNRVMDQLEANGVPRAELDAMSFEDIQQLGRAQAAMDAGQPSQAATDIAEVEAVSDPERVAQTLVEEAAMGPDGRAVQPVDAQAALVEAEANAGARLLAAQQRVEAALDSGIDGPAMEYMIENLDDVELLESILDTHDLDLTPVSAAHLPALNEAGLTHADLKGLGSESIEMLGEVRASLADGNMEDALTWLEMSGVQDQQLVARLMEHTVTGSVSGGSPSMDPSIVRADIQPAVREMFEAGPNRWVPTGMDPQGEQAFQRGISGNYVNPRGGMPETLEWLSGVATDDRSFTSVLEDMSQSDHFMLEVNNQYTSPLAVRGRADLGDLGDGRTGSLPAGSSIDNVSDIGMFENRLQRVRWARQYHRLFNQLSEAGLEIDPTSRGGQFMGELQSAMDSRTVIDGKIANYDEWQSSMEGVLDRYPMQDP